MKEKCLIVFGGKSVEHDISIITAMQMKNFIEEDFVYVYIDKSGIWWTAENADDINTYVNFFKKATGSVKSAGIKAATEKLKPVNFMQEFNARNMFANTENEKR